MRNIKEYYRYGGRGITVCDRWKNSFVNFYKDMGDRPFPKAQLDRIDNNGNYDFQNCRWTTCVGNIRNSSVVKLTMDKASEIRKMYAEGFSSYPQIAKIYNVHSTTIGYIVRNEICKEI